MKKKFKIEIWQYYSVTEIYEAESIEEILDWFRENWRHCYNCGGCAFDVYENGEELLFEEISKLGFYD